MASKTTEWFLNMRENVSKHLAVINKNFTNSATHLKQVQTNLDQTAIVTKKLEKNVKVLNDELKTLKKSRDAAFDTGEIKKFNAEIAATKLQIKELNALSNTPATPAIPKVHIPHAAHSPWHFRAHTEVAPGVKFGGKLGMHPGIIAAMAAAGIGFGMYEFGKVRDENDEAFGKAAFEGGLSENQRKGVRNNLIGAGPDSKKSIEVYGEIISKTRNATLANKIFNESLQTSKASFTDLKDVANAYTEILTSKGNKLTSGGITNLLFGAHRAGRGNFGEFTENMPELLKAATGAGFSQLQSAAAFSFLTKQGHDGKGASSWLGNLFETLGKGDVQSKLGIKKGSGLFDIFNQLPHAMQGLDGQTKKDLLGDLLKDEDQKKMWSELTHNGKTLADVFAELTKNATELSKENENASANLKTAWAAFTDTAGGSSTFKNVENFFAKRLGIMTERMKDFDMSPQEKLKLMEQRYKQDVRQGNTSATYSSWDSRRLGYYDITAEDKIKQILHRDFDQKDSDISNTLSHWKAYATMSVKHKGDWEKKYGSPFETSFGDKNEKKNKEDKDMDMDNIMGNISGGHVRYLTVNVGKMQASEKIELHGEHVFEIYDEIENNVLERLTRVVQGLELAAGRE